MKIVYRYEIFAPGGIIIADFIDNNSPFPDQKEIDFVDDIAPWYIRCAQEFMLITENGER